MQLDLLNTVHIHFGPRSIVLFMMEHPVTVAVREWRFLTGSILAHEMMHAWLRLRDMSSIYDSNGASISLGVSSSSKQGIRSPFERKVEDFFKHQNESDTSPIYGNGFRAGNQACLNMD
ncbi:hypothetical protein KY290_022702 [Solanum tuberosum]|uniref:Protein DA1-like domain-containing protein n=1 Tax=Solanum tuberosum TaxID=4113 RepID=A0ABQ7V552_SOLTU|nr:hypothetical protein KY290_022702 [Solanum tuberosum]